MFSRFCFQLVGRAMGDRGKQPPVMGDSWMNHGPALLTHGRTGSDPWTTRGTVPYASAGIPWWTHGQHTDQRDKPMGGPWAADRPIILL